MSQWILDTLAVNSSLHLIYSFCFVTPTQWIILFLYFYELHAFVLSVFRRYRENVKTYAQNVFRSILSNAERSVVGNNITAQHLLCTWWNLLPWQPVTTVRCNFLWLNNIFFRCSASWSIVWSVSGFPASKRRWFPFPCRRRRGCASAAGTAR